MPDELATCTRPGVMVPASGAKELPEPGTAVVVVVYILPTIQTGPN